MSSEPTPASSTAVTTNRRVLIVEDDTLVGLGLKRQLERIGHTVVGHAGNPAEAVKLYQDTQPDVVLMDIRLDTAPGTDGIELAKELLNRRRCPMVIISAFSEKGLIDRASAAGVFGYLIKPISGESLAAQIEVAIGRFKEHEQLAQTLENRKAIERAKGIFMKRLGLDENEAHRRLQQESQKRRVTIVELAKKLIESEEVFGA